LKEWCPVLSKTTHGHIKGKNDQICAKKSCRLVSSGRLVLKELKTKIHKKNRRKVKQLIKLEKFYEVEIDKYIITEREVVRYFTSIMMGEKENGNYD